MKAMLVIEEMPNQCIECPCYRQVRDDSILLEYCNANKKRLTLQHTSTTHVLSEIVKVPEWCPLKPIPSEACEMLVKGLDAMEKMKSVEVKVVRRTE